MGRRKRYAPLHVLLNGRVVGHLDKDVSGAISFRYDGTWLDWEHAIPVSLSLPLREDAYRGEPVAAVFDNLLPDSGGLRRRIAEKVGAAGSDTYSLLAAIGRDCVGALQFIDDEAPPADEAVPSGDVLDALAIEKLLLGLAQFPLGLSAEDDFRISVAGAQEKTALYWDGTLWLKPRGMTPTTHILKPQIGHLPNGIDLQNSVENEYYCLNLIRAFGLPAAEATIQTFGGTKALVVERFDRHRARDGRLLRLPQEDFCQALSVPPSRKYQNEGGPGLVQILQLLQGSDSPHPDQKTAFQAQVLFWLVGATDGHAKNFSIFLGPSGTYRLTPLYDVLTAQPSLDARQIERKQMKLAMAVGNSNPYRIDGIHGRHFVETGQQAGLPHSMVRSALDEIAEGARAIMDRLGGALPPGFPEQIHASVSRAVMARLPSLAVGK